MPFFSRKNIVLLSLFLSIFFILISVFFGSDYSNLQNSIGVLGIWIYAALAAWYFFDFENSKQDSFLTYVLMLVFMHHLAIYLHNKNRESNK